MSHNPDHRRRNSWWLAIAGLMAAGCSGSSTPVATQPGRAEHGASASDVVDYRFLPTQLNVTTVQIDGRPVSPGSFTAGHAMAIPSDSKIKVLVAGTSQPGVLPSGTNCVVEFLRLKDADGRRLTARATICRMLTAPNGDWTLTCVADTPRSTLVSTQSDEFELIVYGGKVNRLLSIPVRISKR
jgi:hypothetical protein